ncbi:MAG: Hpt domain-containing protein, partial [Deltaproteobacteria bacterium]|nr:Hpt domain-containing protein [Deltaproteobacteria bacterium]
MSQFDEMIPEFVAESQDLLPEVEQGLLALEDDPDSVDQETVNTIFRAIHSIKGGASFVGLHQLERLAHKMEDLLNLIRNNDLAPTPQVSSELLTSLDYLTEMLENVEDSGACEIEGRLASLQAIIDGQASKEVKEAIATPAVSPQEDLASFEVDAYTLDQAFARGVVYFLCFDLMKVEEQGLGALDLVRELLSVGEILSARVQAVPAEDDPLEAASLVLGVLFASIMEEELLKAGLSAEYSRLDSLSREDFPAVKAPPASPPAGEEASAPPPMEPPPQAEAPLP